MMAILESADFWVAVAFVGLAAALIGPLGRMVITALDERSRIINQKLDEASRLHEEAQAVLADCKRKHRDTQRQCEAILNRTRERTAQIEAQSQAALDEFLETRRRQANDRIAQAESEAVQTIREHTTDTAIATARYLLEGELDEKDQNRLIEDAMKNMPKRLH